VLFLSGATGDSPKEQGQDYTGILQYRRVQFLTGFNSVGGHGRATAQRL
jgi:hypothetical protein